MLNVATLSLLLATGIVASLNPPSISMLVMVLSSIFGKGHSTKRLALYGAMYLLGVFLATFALSIIVWMLVSLVPITTLGYVALLLSVGLVVGGLVEIKDYFWYGKKFMLSPPKKVVHYVHDLALKMRGVFEYLMLGIVCGAILFPYLGLAILAISVITTLSFPFHATQAILLFTVVLMVPSLFIYFMALGGIKMSVLTKWKEDSKATMRLTSGVLLIFLAWILTLVANGTIRLG